MTCLLSECRAPSTHLWILAVCLGFGLVPHCADALPRTETAAQRQKRIQMLPEAQRERLARNLKHYESLTPEERARYHKLQADLNEDRRQGGGLDQLLDQYCKWLATLSEEERIQLRNQKNYSLRAEMVKHLLEKQPKKKESEEVTQGDPSQSKDPIASEPVIVAQDPVAEEPNFSPNDPYLSAADLKSVMAVLEKSLLGTSLLNPREQENLESKQGVDRYLYLISFLPRREAGKKEHWLTEPAFREMAMAISDVEQRQKIQADETPLEKTQDLFFLIRGGIHHELETEIEQDAGRRAQLFNKLTYDDQQLIKGAPREKQTALLAESCMKQVLHAGPQFSEELRKQWANQRKQERKRDKLSGDDGK